MSCQFVIHCSNYSKCGPWEVDFLIADAVYELPVYYWLFQLGYSKKCGPWEVVFLIANTVNELPLCYSLFQLQQMWSMRASLLDSRCGKWVASLLFTVSITANVVWELVFLIADAANELPVCYKLFQLQQMWSMTGCLLIADTVNELPVCY